MWQATADVASRKSKSKRKKKTKHLRQWPLGQRTRCSAGQQTTYAHSLTHSLPSLSLSLHSLALAHSLSPSLSVHLRITHTPHTDRSWKSRTGKLCTARAALEAVIGPDTQIYSQSRGRCQQRPHCWAAGEVSRNCCQKANDWLGKPQNVNWNSYRLYSQPRIPDMSQCRNMPPEIWQRATATATARGRASASASASATAVATATQTGDSVGLDFSFVSVSVSVSFSVSFQFQRRRRMRLTAQSQANPVTGTN